MGEQKKRRLFRHLCCVSLNHLTFSVWIVDGLDKVQFAVRSVRSSPFMVWLFCFFPISLPGSLFLLGRYRRISHWVDGIFMRSECSYFTCLWALRLTILLSSSTTYMWVSVRRCACVCVSVWDSTFCTHAINMISSRIFFRLRPHRSSARISMDRMVCGPKTGGMCVCAVCALFYMFSFFMIRTWRLQVVVNG